MHAWLFYVSAYLTAVNVRTRYVIEAYQTVKTLNSTNKCVKYLPTEYILIV